MFVTSRECVCVWVCVEVYSPRILMHDSKNQILDEIWGKIPAQVRLPYPKQVIKSGAQKIRIGGRERTRWRLKTQREKRGSEHMSVKSVLSCPRTVAAVHGVLKSRTRLSDFTFTFHFHALEKENGNPLQCSCLENPRDRGAWWAAVYGVAHSQTRLKWFSTSSGSRTIAMQPTHVLCACWM